MFAYQLAVVMGEINVDAMLRRITAKQFKEWMAYAQLEPFGDVRADLRAASIVQIIANVNRGKKQKAYTLQECMLTFTEQAPKKRQTPQEQLNILKVFSAMHNAAPNAPQG